MCGNGHRVVEVDVKGGVEMLWGLGPEVGMFGGKGYTVILPFYCRAIEERIEPQTIINMVPTTIGLTGCLTAVLPIYIKAVHLHDHQR